MDIVRFKGGLGNQMFQYAFVEALRSRNRMVRCNMGFYRKHPEARGFVLDKVFPKVLLNEIADDYFDEIDKKWRSISSNKDSLKIFCEDTKKRFFWVERERIDEGVYLDEVFDTNNCTFVGYWQSWKYFSNIEQTIRQLYQFENVEYRLLEVKSQLEEIGNLTSIHIRRTDYLKYPEIYGGVCTDDYYMSAMEYIEKNTDGNVNFVVFTDDREWIKENFKRRDFLWVDESQFDKYQDWYDMYLMSLCKNNIIANSSFSWWGAWLNSNKQKIVVAPQKWLVDREMKDICPDTWIRI